MKSILLEVKNFLNTISSAYFIADVKTFYENNKDILIEIKNEINNIQQRLKNTLSVYEKMKLDGDL